MIKHYVVNGHDRYCIEFQRQSNGTFKLYAREHPPDPYGKPVNDNHLYASGEICVAAGYEPTTLDRAKAIAVHFMEGWSRYIRIGTFPTGARRVTV